MWLDHVIGGNLVDPKALWIGTELYSSNGRKMNHRIKLGNSDQPDPFAEYPVVREVLRVVGS